MSAPTFWLIVVIMGLTTYATRVLPFLLGEQHKLIVWLTDENSRLSSLGPALIAAIAAATIAPDFLAVVSAADSTAAMTVETVVYGVGLVIAVLALKLTANSGAAVLVAMVFYGLAQLVV